MSADSTARPRERVVSIPRPRQAIDTVSIDDVPICSWSETQVVDHVMSTLDESQGGVIATPNVDIMRGIAQGDMPLIAEKSDLLVPDGMPLLWASRLQGEPLASRVTGSDLFWSLSRAAAERGRSVFVLGGAPGVAERAIDALTDDAPHLKIAGSAAPAEGFEKDPVAMRHLEDQLVEASPDLVLMSFGSPKQEHLALGLRELMPTTWFLNCGGAIDMAAGDRRRAPRILQMTGLEWLHRLALEPGRLWRRYLVHDLPFVFGMLGRSLRRRRRGPV